MKFLGPHPPRAALAAILALVLASLTPPAGIGAASAQEPPTRAFVARRKALFIEQFTRLIDWPADVLPKGGNFVLCIEGASDTANELTAMAAARKFKERSVEVRRPRVGSDLAGCHLVYVAASESQHLAEVLAAVDGKPILTVSDTAGFVERGVHLNLFEQTRSAPEQKLYVSYELNVDAVKHSVLAFDPQLLSQGRRVDSSGGKP
jgi:hypothetical protein